jgi:hypothetical protein
MSKRPESRGSGKVLYQRLQQYPSEKIRRRLLDDVLYSSDELGALARFLGVPKVASRKKFVEKIVREGFVSHRREERKAKRRVVRVVRKIKKKEPKKKRAKAEKVTTLAEWKRNRSPKMKRLEAEADAKFAKLRARVAAIDKKLKVTQLKSRRLFDAHVARQRGIAKSRPTSIQGKMLKLQKQAEREKQFAIAAKIKLNLDKPSDVVEDLKTELSTLESYEKMPDTTYQKWLSKQSGSVKKERVLRKWIGLLGSAGGKKVVSKTRR